jgi:hypothetical protein
LDTFNQERQSSLHEEEESNQIEASSTINFKWALVQQEVREQRSDEADLSRKMAQELKRNEKIMHLLLRE